MATQYRFVVRRRTAANWTSGNETLLSGEFGLETDTRRLKIGDGVTAWNSLAYILNDTLLALAELDMGAGTPGDVVTLNATNDGFELVAPVVASDGGGGAGSILVASSVVSGSAATSITVSGLDLDTYGVLKLRIRLKNATASGGYCYLYANGDSTAGNYYSQIASFNDTSFSGGRFNNGHLFYLYASSNTTALAELIRDFDGKPICVSRARERDISTVIGTETFWARNDNANLTSLTLTASVAGAFDIGSEVEVWSG